MDLDDFFMWALTLLTVVAVVVLGFLVWARIHTTSGIVTDKYYDDPDIVCSKGCVTTRECWTIVVDKPWYADNKACVDESEYDTISVGDYFTTDK